MEEKQNCRRRSDDVGLRMSLMDVRLRSLQAELIQPSPQLPLRPTIELAITAGQMPPYAYYDVKYSINAVDSFERLVFKASIVFNLVFAGPDPTAFEDEELKAFGHIGVVSIAHPYARELAQNLTTRMGLPPFVLDVMAPVTYAIGDDLSGPEPNPQVGLPPA